VTRQRLLPPADADFSSMLGRRITGVVSFYGDSFGFIKAQCSRRKYEFFVHHSDVHASGLSFLVQGEPVEFELAAGRPGKGVKAVKIKMLLQAQEAR
jgi:cold shock CspA family protein